MKITGNRRDGHRELGGHYWDNTFEKDSNLDDLLVDQNPTKKTGVVVGNTVDGSEIRLTTWDQKKAVNNEMNYV